MFAGQIDHLDLDAFLINCTCETVLVSTLISPHSSLRKLTLSNCTFSRGVYNRLITVIATSKLTHFATNNLNTDVTRAKVVATLLVDSKTLEEVKVIEQQLWNNNDVAVILAEAMNQSSVKNLKIGHFSKGTVLDCHYPTDRVNLVYW